MISIGSLFISIIVHKALVAFSVGMSLAKALSHNKKMIVLLIVLLALFSPIGGVVGIIVQVIFGVLQSIKLTFLVIRLR